MTAVAHECFLAGLGIATIVSLFHSPMEIILLSGIASGFLWFFIRPIMEKQQQARLVHRIEQDLPYALLELDVLLSLHWPFEQAIRVCIQQNETNAFWNELKPYFAQPKERTLLTLQSLESRVMETKSVLMSQAVGHLLFIYQQEGKKSNDLGLKDLATHALQQQRLRQQAFSKQLAFYTILFVALSTIIPTLIQSFLVLGSLFLDISIEPFMVLVILVGLIPLLNAALLVFIYQQQGAGA